MDITDIAAIAVAHAKGEIIRDVIVVLQDAAKVICHPIGKYLI